MRELRKELANCMAIMLCLILAFSVGALGIERQISDIVASQIRIAKLMERNERLEMVLRNRVKSLDGKSENCPSENSADDSGEVAVLIEDFNADDDADWNVLCGCRVFHYCACKRCTGKSPSDKGYGLTATGTVATPNRTVAVDPSVIPLGSEIDIDGVTYIAEDTGVKGNCIDIYVSSHDEAKCLGTYVTNLKWK